MANYQNHLVDPTFFYDAINFFAFDYDWYVSTGETIDDYGRKERKFNHITINGSLQSQGTQLEQSIDLNTEQMGYRFYCKSLYRINVGDFMFYKERWLHVESVRDYDEWGVRSATLKMVNLNNYQDFVDYLRYLNGETTV